MNRRLLVGLAVLAIGAAGAGGWLLVDDGDGDGDGSSTIESLPEAGLPDRSDANTTELRDLLLRGRDSPVHAVFESAGDTADLGGSVTIELWRHGARARYEHRLTTSDGVAVTTTLVGTETVTSCTAVDDGPPECTEEPVAEADAGGLLGVPLEGDLDAVTRDIGGAPARCFLTGEAELCVDGDGVPLLLRVGDARLVRVVLDDAVSEADLTEPPDG